MPEFIDNKSVFLKDKLKQLLNESDEAMFALAFVRQSGLNMLIQEITRLIQRKGKLLVLFANDFGATEPEAIVSLQEVGAEIRFFSSNQSFHPKAYIFKKAHAGNLVIGSSNLSASGLSTGVEWSISTSSNEIDFSRVLKEFNNLWTSESAKAITPELIGFLASQVPDREFKRTVIQEDMIPVLPTILSSNNLFNKSKNYVVKRSPDPHATWNFNIFENQIRNYARKGDFNLVVICDFRTSNQRVFVIPYSYLKGNILANAHLDKYKRYLFEINKHSFRFNWHYSVKMDGKLFLTDTHGT